MPIHRSMKAKSLLELILAFFRPHGSITNTPMPSSSPSPNPDASEASVQAEAQPPCSAVSAPQPCAADTVLDSIEQISKIELLQYEQAVQKAIREKSEDIFPNESQAHAAIVIREFIKAAQEKAFVYCGRLSSAVYSDLLPYIRAAENRGVDVRFVVNCQHGQEETTDLAEYLAQRKLLKNYIQSPDIAHFSVVDSRMFRVETNRAKRRALVCASATGSENVEMVGLMEDVFLRLWNKATAHA